MSELYLIRLKGYAAVFVASFRSIFEVSSDGIAYAGELRSDLMLAACHEVYFKQRVVVPGFDDGVFKAGESGLGGIAVTYEGLVYFAV